MALSNRQIKCCFVSWTSRGWRSRRSRYSSGKQIWHNLPIYVSLSPCNFCYIVTQERWYCSSRSLSVAISSRSMSSCRIWETKNNSRTDNDKWIVKSGAQYIDCYKSHKNHGTPLQVYSRSLIAKAAVTFFKDNWSSCNYTSRGRFGWYGSAIAWSDLTVNKARQEVAKYFGTAVRNHLAWRSQIQELEGKESLTPVSHPIANILLLPADEYQNKNMVWCVQSNRKPLTLFPLHPR